MKHAEAGAGYGSGNSCSLDFHYPPPIPNKLSPGSAPTGRDSSMMTHYGDSQSAAHGHGRDCRAAVDHERCGHRNNDQHECAPPYGRRRPNLISG